MSPKRDVSKLLVDAKMHGQMSDESLDALAKADATNPIERTLGTSLATDLTQVMLVTILVDDSDSIEYAKNTEAVRRGHNRVAKTIIDAHSGRRVLLLTQYLNGRVINPFTPLLEAEPLTTANYDPETFGMTPLFRQSIITLGAVMAKTRELEALGKDVRSATLIITDGSDNCSGNSPSSTAVAWLVNDLRRTNRHIVAGMGVDDGSTDFRRVFQSMGIPRDWILTPDSDPAAIIAAFQKFGDVAAQASLNPATFTRVALGPGLSK